MEHSFGCNSDDRRGTSSRGSTCKRGPRSPFSFALINEHSAQDWLLNCVYIKGSETDCVARTSIVACHQTSCPPRLSRTLQSGSLVQKTRGNLQTGEASGKATARRNTTLVLQCLLTTNLCSIHGRTSLQLRKQRARLDLHVCKRERTSVVMKPSTPSHAH